jgi:tetratricopeptide (TPR) repeat protein
MLMLLPSASALAQVSAGLATLNQQCRAYIDRGEYDEALRRCKSALANAEQLAPGSSEHIASLVSIGDLKRLELNYVDADLYYTSALKIVEAQQGNANAPDPNVLLDKIIAIKVKRGKFFEATQISNRLLQQQQKRAGANDAGVARLKARNADLLSQSRLFPEAEQSYLEALAVLETAGPALNAVYAQTVQHFAETYERQGKYLRAEGEYRKLLSVVQERKLGSDWEALALDRLGYMAEQQDQPTQALAFYQREMEILHASGAPAEVSQGLQSKVARLALVQQPAAR